SATNRIELQVPVLDAHAIKKRREQFNHLGVARRRSAADRRRPNHFCSNLIKLPVPPLLRTLPPELWPYIEELVNSSFPKLVLDVSAHHSGSIFRPQRERLPRLALCARPVFPRVHFLGNNIGLFSDRSRKQLRLLENWRADFLKVVGAKHVARGCFDKVP